MKKHILKGCLCFVLLASLATEVSAQRPSRRRGDAQRTQQQPGQPAPGGNEQVPPPPPPSGYNPYGNIPIEVDSTGVSDSVIRKSARPDNIYDRAFTNKERVPLAYDHIRWDDALFSEKVWRELDLREKMNQPFRYQAESDEGSQIFMDILLRAVNSGEVTTFSDDRFTTPMSLGEISQLTVGSADTVAVRKVDDPNVIEKYVVTRATFDSKGVTKLRIKEEWVFDRETSRMVVRILGIAPVKTLYFPNGQERGSSTMFWVYYPDLRPTLAKHEVYNSKNMGYGSQTWEELFESRMFSSYIVKSTMENPQNRNIRQMVKDPILALLEGENVKEKIFNYEQDLWSY
ncbi:gliding motility protein GldN [Paraflavisolibacter sp. H34]|uniref:type IX secretion system ring protein PorN/GldN n=1 Tax=Huijunlia imazamoxiresistens TaxID=3127457 RepID=UPI003017EC3A